MSVENTRPVRTGPADRITSLQANERKSSAGEPFGSLLAKADESMRTLPPSSEAAQRQLEAVKLIAEMQLMQLNNTLLQAFSGQSEGLPGGLGGETGSSGMEGWLKLLGLAQVDPGQLEERVKEQTRRPEEARGKPTGAEAGGTNKASWNRPEYRDFDAAIENAASVYGLDSNLVRAVIKTESDFDPTVVSKAGAMGLMQLMPGTARDLGVDDPFDPEANIHGGVKYLRQMLDRFGGDLDRALAAYNWGPGNLEKSTGYLPEETRNYIERVNRHMGRFTASRQT